MAHIQYVRTVGWDVTLSDLGLNETGLVVDGLKITTGAPAATAGYFAPGCILQNIVSGVLYSNTGTTASPVWGVIDAGAGLTLPASLTDSTTTTTTSLALVQNGITSGKGLTQSLTGMTTGLGHQIIAAAAVLTTGRYYSANDGALEVFGVGANGHLHSAQTTAPTAGTNATGISAVAVTAGSTDVCGTITTTGTPASGTVLTITFNKTYTTAPKFVTVEAANAAAGGVNTPPIVTQTATTFVLTWPAGGVYAATPSFTYYVHA